MEALCVDFINSEFRDFRGRWVRDDLQQPDWMDQFLTKWGLQVEQPPDTDVLSTLVSLRTFLRSMIETLVEGTITEQDQATLNAIMLKMPLCRSLEKDTHGLSTGNGATQEGLGLGSGRNRGFIRPCTGLSRSSTSQNMCKHVLPWDLL